MGSIDQIKHSRMTGRVLLAASALGIAGLIGLSAAAADSISKTGPFSYNEIKNVHVNSTVKVNATSVTANSYNTQTAYSGSAESNGNTVGGKASSGSATNVNSTTTTVVVVNK